MTIQDAPRTGQPQDRGPIGDAFKRVRLEVGFTTIRAVADNTRFTYDYLVKIENNEETVTRRQRMNIIGQVRCAAERLNLAARPVVSNHPTARPVTDEEMATARATAQTLGRVLWESEDEDYFDLVLNELLGTQTTWTWRMRVIALSYTLSTVREHLAKRYPVRDPWVFRNAGLEELPR